MTNTKDPERAMDALPVTSNSAAGPVTFSQVFGQQCQLMEAAVQSMHTLNDQLSHFIVNKSKMLDEDKDAFLPSEKESLKNSMMLMRHLLMDAQDTQNLYGVGDAGTPSYANPFIPVHHILSSD
ncbi:hypothetical protein KIL84_022116 [Mauremys mutica]|uniref:Kazrin n=1 Tax=Mauremys mutica TaxID=74926 RepID=A0A9D4B0D2_9SAUR|nr:hypothetical protein KIL84_022116 [Mauremys mutica]